MYFDINDFDASARVPAAWDGARFLASLWTARKGFRLDKQQAEALTQLYLDACSAELCLGKAGWLERATAEGMIRDLRKGLKTRSRQTLIEARTELDGKRLCLDGERALAADGESQVKVQAILAQVEKVHEQATFSRS